MTQKMDKVGVPIKLRAILKGITTGWNDRYHYHDNSWWVSFGASATLMWIRRWLLLLMGTMVATFLYALVHLIVVGAQVRRGDDTVGSRLCCLQPGSPDAGRAVKGWCLWQDLRLARSLTRARRLSTSAPTRCSRRQCRSCMRYLLQRSTFGCSPNPLPTCSRARREASSHAGSRPAWRCS